jgi:plasmid stability protein
MHALHASKDKAVASLTIRDLDEKTKARLRVRAAHRQRSMEEEARQILREALARDEAPSGNLAERIRSRFAALGGVDLVVPTRELLRDPPRFRR